MPSQNGQRFILHKPSQLNVLSKLWKTFLPALVYRKLWLPTTEFSLFLKHSNHFVFLTVYSIYVRRLSIPVPMAKPRDLWILLKEIFKNSPTGRTSVNIYQHFSSNIDRHPIQMFRIRSLLQKYWWADLCVPFSTYSNLRFKNNLTRIIIKYVKRSNSIGNMELSQRNSKLTQRFIYVKIYSNNRWKWIPGKIIEAL